MREFVPTFASQAERRKMSRFQLPQRLGSNGSGRMASGAITSEAWPALLVKDCLSHDGASRVPGAQKQYVVMSFHCGAVALLVTAGWTTAGFLRARRLDRANESAEEFSVDLWGEGVNVDSLPCKKFAGIFCAINPGRLNFNLLESGAR